jgi:hypothetical protein
MKMLVWQLCVVSGSFYFYFFTYFLLLHHDPMMPKFKYTVYMRE